MKTLLVVLVVCVIAASCFLNDEQKAKLKQHQEVCLKQAGADKATIDSIQKGRPELGNLDFKCHIACVLKRIGIMRPDGSIDEELTKKKVASTKIEAAKVDAVIQRCKDAGGKDDCEKAENITTCFLKNEDLNTLFR